MRILVLAAMALGSGCLSAQTTWTSFADRRGHAMARTSTGGVVMFGGESVSSPGELLGDTAALSTNNQTWTGVGAGPGEPPSTTGHAMAGALPSGQQAYVMFGGITSTGPSARTYKYNGNAWGDVTSGVSPLARSGHAMATNTATNTVLMFGGFDGTLALNDVWEFAPSTDTWTPQTVAAAPIGRFGACLAFHPGSGGSNGRLYMFGGSPFRNDLWEFNPVTSTWAQLFPAVSPPGRRHAAMAYLAGSDMIVLFGGLSTGGVIRNDTWSYDRGTNTWTQQSPTLAPPARYEHAVSADNTGNNLVLLGGTNVLPGTGAGPVLDETWLWSSQVSNWIRQLPSPSARDGAAMAYDGQRNRHVVFGGRTVPAATDLNETWEIDGLNWRQRTPSSPPSARSDAGMVFDPTRNVTVLYGGRDGGGDRNDTWEWNGSSWTPRQSATQPPAAGGLQLTFDSSARQVVWAPMNLNVQVPPRLQMWSYDGVDWYPDSIPMIGGGCVAYDSVRSRLVLSGGRDVVGLRSGAWEWDGGSWSHSGGATPPPRDVTALVFGGGSSLLWGGYDGVSFFDDLWLWNGSAWQAGTQGPQRPAARGYHAAVFDSLRGRMILFGGSSGAPLNDTWEFDLAASSWSRTAVGASIPPLDYVRMAFDAANANVVLFGGRVGFTTNSSDTWVYDTATLTWAQRFPLHVPPARMDQGMAYVGSGIVVMHGGYDAGVSLGDTWTWNGTDWTDVSSSLPGLSPGARSTVGMATAGSRALLFGGSRQYSAASFVSYNDVWEWTNAGWHLLDPGQPLGRTNFGAAYDARRDRLIVFGGMSSNNRSSATYNNETWEWDGDSWQQRTPTSGSPSPRGWCKLAFDEARARVVLYGGADSTNTFDDTWEWDGSAWTQRNFPPPLGIPPGSFGHDLTFDSARKVTVAFGSMGTWNYGPINPARTTLYGTGCPTSGSVPASAPFGLKPLPWTGAWLGEPVEMEFTNAPPGLGLFLFGLSYTQFGAIPLPLSLALVGLGPAACMLRNSADVIEAMPVGVTRYVSFPMPSSPSALGLPLYGQAAFFDLGQPGFPVVTSDGVEMVIGQK